MLTLSLALAFYVGAMPDADPPPEPAQMRGWIDAMKSAPRGPFKRIRWFCADGAILPPGEYVCRGHGGGVQHGEWNERTVAMRDQGYLVATLLADLDPDDFVGADARLDELRQLLLERFLIQIDDGWVFRRARYYRGAIQIEDERRMASRLMLALIEDDASREPARYLLLREAARLLPVGGEPPAAARVRELAIEIAERDPGFQDLRVKLHGLPDASDPQRVRDYASAHGRPELARHYETLATQLDILYAPQTTASQLEQLAAEADGRTLKETLRAATAGLRGTEDLQARLALAANFGREWRELFAATTDLGTVDRLRLLQASLALEHEVYAIGNRLVEEHPEADRLTRLQWLADLGGTLYASGLLSRRQWRHMDLRLEVLTLSPLLPADTYAAELRYLARIPTWSQRAMEFQFGRTVTQWSDITPLAVHFVPDRLRSSPLLAYTRALDTLRHDANALAGVTQELFGRQVSGGLRALNPGLRRGLLFEPPEDPARFRSDAIYLLPSTTPELPPVAGILTLGEGSSLSHVQLLARNLGIPNVVVSETLAGELESRIGTRIVVAASPRGGVRIADDGRHWDPVFGAETRSPEIDIRPDLGKLDLQRTALHRLDELRAHDAGRSVGPKAANLGELHHHYPQHVSRGVVIPFGVFRALLERPIQPGGPSAFEWLRTEYARLERIADPAQRQAETRQMLSRLRQWITSTDPGEDFRLRLRRALETGFGSADTPGVFVRSDTNVEDLPGFTGAGLNLTVPNVVGFEAIVQAVQRVWASPFTERAYAWRQSHMSQPEHVYPSVLLQETVPVDKSGVLVTTDVETGDERWLSIAVNEGVGGAVEGQAAEELRVHRVTGEVRLLAQATAPLRTEPAADGGMRKVPASGHDEVLTPEEIERLRALANDVTQRFPVPLTPDGVPAAMDIEFGFHDGQLALFQIRPFVESRRARQTLYLIEMDEAAAAAVVQVDLRRRPTER